MSTTDLEQQMETLSDQLKATRAAEKVEADAQAEATKQRDVAYRRTRVGSYDAAALTQTTSDARAKLETALAASPVFGALIDYMAAQWAEYRGLNTLHNDRITIALADSQPVPDREPSNPRPTLDVLEVLGKVLDAQSLQTVENDALAETQALEAAREGRV